MAMTCPAMLFASRWVRHPAILPALGQPAQFLSDKGGQAGRGDGVAAGNVAFDLEQVVLRIGDIFPAFQIAQPAPFAGLLDRAAAVEADLDDQRRFIGECLADVEATIMVPGSQPRNRAFHRDEPCGEEALAARGGLAGQSCRPRCRAPWSGDSRQVVARFVAKTVNGVADAASSVALPVAYTVFPNEHPVLAPLSPSAEAVVRALAGRGRTRLQPAGAHAANALGLSEQVPAMAVFHTDGQRGRSRSARPLSNSVGRRQRMWKRPAA